MDFDPYQSRWRENVPPMTLLEACWQMTSPRGRVLTCGVFRTIAGLEVRCGYSEEDLIRSQYAREVETATLLRSGLSFAPISPAGIDQHDLAREHVVLELHCARGQNARTKR